MWYYWPIRTVPCPAEWTVSPSWWSRRQRERRSALEAVWLLGLLVVKSRWCELEEGEARPVSPGRSQSGKDAERAGSRDIRSARKAPASIDNTASGRRKKESQGQESKSLWSCRRGASSSSSDPRLSGTTYSSRRGTDTEADRDIPEGCLLWWCRHPDPRTSYTYTVCPPSPPPPPPLVSSGGSVGLAGHTQTMLFYSPSLRPL